MLITDVLKCLRQTIYPNPADKTVNISVPSKGSIAIINTVGEYIYNSRALNKLRRIGINTTGWASGLYIVKWQGEDGSVMTGRFIKN